MSISVASKASFTGIQQNILPGQTCAFDIGSITLQWRNMFLNGYLSLLGSEAGAVERRLRENVGDIQLVDATSTLLRSLNTDVLPTTLTPTSIATIGTSPSYSRGDHIHGIDTTGFDGRYIKRSPSGENQTILPLTANVPLTIKGFAGGASKLLDIFDSSSPTQFEKWYWDNNANLTMLFGNPPGAGTKSLQTSDTLGNVSTILFVNTAGALQFGGNTGDTGPLGALGTQQWRFVGASIVFANTGSGFGIAVNNIAKANNTPTAGTAWLLRNPTTEEIDIGTTGPLVLFGTKIDNSNNLMQFLSFVLEQLTADPVSHTTGRVYERTDLKQVSWDDGSVFHRLIDSSPSGVAQTILPLTDSIALTIKGFAGGASDVLDIYDDSSPQVLRWKFQGGGALLGFSNIVLQQTGDTNPRIALDTLNVPSSLNYGSGSALIDTLLQREAAGLLRITVANVVNTPAQLGLLGNEASAAERRIRENAGALEITDTTPTVLRSVITRGAPNVAVAHNVTSVTVTFSTMEPDTNYEITVIPAYNTTVFYTSKLTTGFTANFGTAGPVGGSTFDWHIERIPRT